MGTAHENQHVVVNTDGAGLMHLCGVWYSRTSEMSHLALATTVALKDDVYASLNSYMRRRCPLYLAVLPAPPSTLSPAAMNRRLCEVMGCQVQPSYGPLGTYFMLFITCGMIFPAKNSAREFVCTFRWCRR